MNFKKVIINLIFIGVIFAIIYCYNNMLDQTQNNGDIIEKEDESINSETQDMKDDYDDIQQVINDEEILKMSFEERTASYFEKREELKGDKISKEFNNIRLTKVDNHYELKADLIGAVKIETRTLEDAIEQIKQKKIEKLEIETANDEKVTIYSSKPKEIIDWHENEKNYYNENEWDFDEAGVPLYDDDDWIKAQSDAEWLDKNGIPMYVEYEEYGGVGSIWARLSKQEDGYYLISRDAVWLFSVIDGLDTETGLSPVRGTVEKNAILIHLLANDKIVLDINDVYGNLPDDFEPTVLTVEEYYNLSPKDGTAYIMEDNLDINISNMCASNYYGIGLEIKDEAIHVVARCDGP